MTYAVLIIILAIVVFVLYKKGYLNQLFKNAEVAKPASVASAATNVASTATDVPNSGADVPNPSTNAPKPSAPGDAIDSGRPTVTDLLYKPDPRTAAILDGRVGQSAGPAPDLDPGMAYYIHPQPLYGPGPVTIKLEQPIKPGTKLSLSYMGQDGDKKGPSQVWINDSPALQVGVEALWPVSGDTAIVKMDTDGRVSMQLRVEG